MTQADALSWLRSKVAADKFPELTDPELLRLLDSVQTALPYKAGTVYGYGDSVFLDGTVTGAPRNGRRYRCAEGGTSAAAGNGPDWPVNRAAYLGQVFTDGVTGLVWVDAGEAESEPWDLNAAAHQGWLDKAGKAAEMIDTSDASEKLQLSQVREHCIRQAAHYAPMWVV